MSEMRDLNTKKGEEHHSPPALTESRCKLYGYSNAIWRVFSIR